MSAKVMCSQEETFPCPSSPVLRPRKLKDSCWESPIFKYPGKANASLIKE